MTVVGSRSLTNLSILPLVLTLGPHRQSGQGQGHTQRGEEHILALVVRLSHQLIVQAISKLQVSLDHWFSAVVTGLMMMMMPVVSSVTMVAPVTMVMVAPVTMVMVAPMTVVTPVTMVMVAPVVAPVTMVMVAPVTVVGPVTMVMVATVTVVAVTSVTFVTSDLSRAEHSHNDPQTQGCPHLGNYHKVKHVALVNQFGVNSTINVTIWKMYRYSLVISIMI